MSFKLCTFRIIICIGILSGELDPLSTFFEGNSVSQEYDVPALALNYAGAAEYIAASAYKFLSLKILEVGAGTGAFTEVLLRRIASTDSSGEPHLNCSTYFYTDIAPSFLDRGKERFSAYGHQLTFKTLNMEEDPIVQGFEAQSFDLVAASGARSNFILLL